MGSKPAFHASLTLPDPREPTDPRRQKPGGGPDAVGPIAPGDEMLWVYAWIIQNGDEDERTWSAAADGESPDGKTFKDEWTIQTEMTHGSDDFDPNTAAVATAMALMKRADGSKDVYWWTDAVKFK
jgi:hypothetical protein